jgi:hypothetical protein
MVRDWTQEQGNLFRPCAPTVMGNLSLIIAVATFNIISMLMMVVPTNSRTSPSSRRWARGGHHHARVRDPGRRHPLVARIVVGDILLAQNIGAVVPFIERLFGFNLFPRTSTSGALGPACCRRRQIRIDVAGYVAAVLICRLACPFASAGAQPWWSAGYSARGAGGAQDVPTGGRAVRVSRRGPALAPGESLAIVGFGAGKARCCTSSASTNGQGSPGQRLLLWSLAAGEHSRLHNRRWAVLAPSPAVEFTALKTSRCRC